MPRKKIPKKLAKSTLFREDNPNGIGNCWHCGKNLNNLSRKKWHVDHHPVVHADIENQLCFGITKTLDPGNLVPSCPECNMSHQYERTYWYFCNRSQFPCLKSFWYIIFGSFFILFIFLLGFYIGKNI